MTLYVVNFKSMGGPREGLDGRRYTMPIRRAEARAVRRIIEDRFGADQTSSKRFVICGDMNDYQERVDVIGRRRTGYSFQHQIESESALDVFSQDDFAENVVRRRDPLDRWTLYHARGPDEQWLCQLDYLWLSPALAKTNAGRLPEIIRYGQPYRTVFPPGQEVERYPRTGWDRPKASDHCPVVMTLDLI
jgi:exonuclease III